jgi:DNA replication protein DnaC
LPAIKQAWAAFAERADKEGWPAARFLASLAEHEIAERDRRRIERHLIEARLLPGKTLDSFEFEAVPMVSKAHVMAICAGDSWIDKGANLILIGGPGGGKTHLASAIGLVLVENGWRVLFARTSDLVQKLQVARRELGLEAAINRLDRFHLVGGHLPPTLDDLAYVSLAFRWRHASVPKRWARIRRKPRFCLNSSALVTNAAPRSSPPISHSEHGARFFPIPP